MTTVEILRAARAKIEKPEAWAKGGFACDARGYAVGARNPLAICFCSIGAIRRVTASFAEELAARDVLSEIVEAIGMYGLAEWNDAPERTHAEVLAAFDKAISLAEEAGAR